MEAGQRDKLATTISSNSTKSYRIDSCNKSIATGQIPQLSRNRAMHFRPLVPNLKILSVQSSTIHIILTLDIFNQGQVQVMFVTKFATTAYSFDAPQKW